MMESDDPSEVLIKNTPLFNSFNVYESRTGEGFELWRSALGPLIEANPLDIESPFYAGASIYLVDGIVFGTSFFSPQSFTHGSSNEKWNEPDQLYIQLALLGGYRAHHAGKEILIYPGDITIYDQEKPVDADRTSGTNYDINLVISRKTAEHYFGDIEALGGRKIPGLSPEGKILGNELVKLYTDLSTLSVVDASQRLDMMLHMISALFYATDLSETTIDIPSAVEHAHFARIEHWIVNNLTNSNLSIELICKNCFISRSTLYRIFNPFGGIATYIHELRLRRCLEDIVRYNGSNTMSTIAESWGYRNYPQFSRLFKKRFGVSPKDIREDYCDNPKNIFSQTEQTFMSETMTTWFSSMTHQS